MTPTLSGREQILARVRAATGSAQGRAEAYGALPRPYIRHGSLTGKARLELLMERLREYDAEVVEAAPEQLPDAIASQLAASGRRVFVAPEGLPSAWLIAGFDWRIDHGLAHHEIEEAEGVVTASFCGIADSGTIVLHHTAAEGRRVLTLLPDWHLCILRASQVVETLPEYFDRCETLPMLHPSNADPSLGAPVLHPSDEDLSLGAPVFHPSDEDLSLGAPVLATYVSGPSATADIEMTRIKGVHGPRFLHVILVHDES